MKSQLQTPAAEKKVLKKRRLQSLFDLGVVEAAFPVYFVFLVILSFSKQPRLAFSIWLLYSLTKHL